mgnify:CR=1 FL=1
MLGKKGELTAVLTLLRSVPAAEKPAVGARINVFREQVETAFGERLRALLRQAREAELSAQPFDLSLPGRTELGRGHLHPVAQTRDALLAIFRDLGFAVGVGPEIELEANNFTKLAFPPDHPATDMQDSFWIGSGVLLRTHTSNVQVREMMALAERVKAGTTKLHGLYFDITKGELYRLNGEAFELVPPA